METISGNSNPKTTAVVGWSVGLLAALFVVAYILVPIGRWIFRPANPRPAPPVPIILSNELVKNLVTANEMKITIRNDGPAGLVGIEIYSVVDAGGQYTRGESGIEKTLRETLTRENAPQPTYIPDNQRIGYGSSNAHFQRGETKTITISIPRYNWTSSLTGVKLYVDAKGMVPSPGAK